MTIDDVKMWAVYHGIGHVAVSGDGTWISTLCDQWGNPSLTDRKPNRICRTCRTRIVLVREKTDTNQTRAPA